MGFMFLRDRDRIFLGSLTSACLLLKAEQKRGICSFLLKKDALKRMCSCDHNKVVDGNAALLLWQSLALPVLIDKKISAQLSTRK